ncbi:hypothetical protein ESCO_006396 [Escovopsis weberi]|uniref:Uncharacterized protein n=1 Tax=Escovopsis weberi TaxID=150374 RepID=A0A0M8MZ74_ESCWE|nr:hypothetical protein ESCO_006396 [Escovopsis weberi]
MRTSRKELKRMRREKDAADNAFMSVVRPMLVLQGGPRHAPADLLHLSLGKMQKLRDDYQVLEASYEKLESMLDGEERDLGILETQFFGLLANGQTAVKPRSDGRRRDSATAQEDAYLDSDIPSELRGISRDGPTEEPHPLYRELMSAIGDLENAKEEFEDLHCVKEQYEHERSLNRATGQQNLEEMIDFFTDFPSEEQRMKESVETMEAEVQRLKGLCEEKKVMKKHLSVRMEYALNPRIKYEDLDLDDREVILQQRSSLAHPEFTELLSQPDHLLAGPEPLTALGGLMAATMLANDDPSKPARKRLAAKEYAIDNLMRDCHGAKKADFVNRWLLHQLRTSPLNAVLLRSVFLASRSLKIRDPWRWQCDVLHYWWRDQTMALAESSSRDNATNDDSERSSGLGTPQLSRAASDRDARPEHWNSQHKPRVDGHSSSAMTVRG